VGSLRQATVVIFAAHGSAMIVDRSGLVNNMRPPEVAKRARSATSGQQLRRKVTLQRADGGDVQGGAVTNPWHQPWSGAAAESRRVHVWARCPCRADRRCQRMNRVALQPSSEVPLP